MSTNLNDKAFEDIVNKQISQLADKALDAWFKGADKKLKSALDDLLEDVAKQLAKSISRSVIDGGQTVFNPAASGGGSLDASASVANALGSVISFAISSAFENEKTRISSTESERSVNADQRFKLSKSQQHAQAAQAASKGQRNL